MRKLCRSIVFRNGRLMFVVGLISVRPVSENVSPMSVTTYGESVAVGRSEAIAGNANKAGLRLF